MGIVKLFSKNREKNTRRISLKYDQRRHSSMSYFTAPPSIYNTPANPSMNNRLMDGPNGLRINRDSALMLSASGAFSKENDNPSSITTDVQNTPKLSRKSESKHPNNRFSQHSKRRSTSKVLSLYSMKCTCDKPSTSSANLHRASAPFLDVGISNKYEFTFKEESEKDLINDSQSENALDADGIDNTLYSELLSTQLSLKSILIKSTPQIQKSVELAINRIGGALEMASSLETRLKTVIEVSKKTILDKAQKIQYLENQLQSEKLSFDANLQDTKALENKLKDVDEIVKQVEFLLLESQIEPTKEEGGTLLQRIESLLAISTASSLLNDKLRSELETSDTKVRELFNETSRLRTLVENDDQKLKQEKELCHLQMKVYDLEKNISHLTHQLESSNDTIQLLKDENRQKSKQLSDSQAAFRKKKDIEFCNNIIKPKNVQHENKHFIELPDEDSLTAWQEIAQNRLQLGGFESSESNFMEFQKTDTEEKNRFLHTDMKQSFSSCLEPSERHLEEQVDHYQPIITDIENKLEETNNSAHDLPNPSNDTTQHIVESKRQSLDRFLSADQYPSKYSQDHSNKLKTFHSLQDLEDKTTRRVNHNGFKSDISLNRKEFHTDMGKYQDDQISGMLHQWNVLDNKICTTQLVGSEKQYDPKSKKQEELIRIHTRAQLGLIEYLEGENNMSLAISRFRKQLENEMNKLEYLN